GYVMRCTPKCWIDLGKEKGMFGFNRLRVVFALAIFCGLCTAPVRGEAHFTFTRVVDTSTPMPRPTQGYPSIFSSFDAPALDGGRLVFRGGIGGNGHPPQGIYEYSNGSLSI